MKRLAIFLAYLYLAGALVAQDHAELHQKYDQYRDRFRTYFIAIGEGHGKSIPFGKISQSVDGRQVISSGESTFLLGTYIGFLGTEYRLFKTYGKNTDETIEELFFALKALNRLDYWAETYNNYGKAPELNGFLVREDIPTHFCADSICKLPERTSPTPHPYQDGSGRIMAIDHVYDATNEHCFEHTPLSQDHMIRILWGLYLAHECVDEGIKYGGRTFLDGEQDLKRECRLIFNRLIERCKADRWILKDPLGNQVANCQSQTGLIFTFRNNLLNAYHQLNGKIRVNLHLPVMARAVAGIGRQTGWINTRMWLETRNLSGEQSGVWNFAYRYGYETYFLPYGMLIHDWSLTERQRLLLKNRCEFDLITAPEWGPFDHGEGDFANWGWRSADRTERSLRFQYAGISHVRGNFSGLDFLLLHNLYYLVFPETNPLEKPKKNWEEMAQQLWERAYSDFSSEEKGNVKKSNFSKLEE